MDESVRLDRWLLAARCFKTRPLAQEACDGGHVRLNGRAGEPSKPVQVGDMVEALTPSGRRVLRVVGLGERRGTAEQAEALYDDLTPPPAAEPDPTPRALRDPGAGRPTKKDARLLRNLRGY